jgi:tellurite resistance protein TerC
LHLLSWVIFAGIILCVLALDLFVFNKKTHQVSFKEALIWSGIWIILALLFAVYIWQDMGSVAATNYLTGYLIEKMLSVDNLFVFIIIFNYFHIPEAAWHKVLFWGVLGAIITRALFIVLGLTLVQAFHPVIYLFGAFLVFTGVKLCFQKGKKISPKRNLILKVSNFFFSVDESYTGENFFIRKKGKIFATPLWIALIAIETADIVFAADSIPAILAITYDPFIVFTSNIFAILGLRSLFFLLAHSLTLFRHLHYAISLILVFVGLKMLLSDVIKIPPLIALGFVCLILVVFILASLWLGKRSKEKTDE